MSNTLFSGYIRWGYEPGARLPHIIDRTVKGVTIDRREWDYRRVSQGETYLNAGDDKTGAQFIELANRCDNDYRASGDPAFRKVMQSIRTYLMASSRSAQQKALADVKKKVGKYYGAKKRAGKLNGPDGDRIGYYHTVFCDPTATRFSGDLKVEANALNEQNSFRVGNPGGTLSGSLGFWTKTDEELFPHEPSPNDIKEGLGASDCFMLSALTQIAANDPQKIRDAMKDNGDGTVTVRFYDEEKPVYITVEKSVNRFLGLGNLYASGALWVQMMEKAYVGYQNKVKGKSLSYKEIDFSNTYKFMNAFEPDKVIPGAHNWDQDTHNYCQKDLSYGRNWGAPYRDLKEKSIFETRRNGYLKHENDFYDFLKTHVNGTEGKAKEVITVGSVPLQADTEEKVLNKRGIRVMHAYAINRVFEQEVNDGKGHTYKKKFVQLRDPYGMYRSTYNGRGIMVNDSREFVGTATGGTDNMGTFNLELVDFLKCFNSFSGLKSTTAADYDKRVTLLKEAEMIRQIEIADDPARAEEYAQMIRAQEAAGPEGQQPQGQPQLRERPHPQEQIQLRERPHPQPQPRQEEPQMGDPFDDLGEHGGPQPDETKKSAEHQRLDTFVDLSTQLSRLKRTTWGFERADSPEMVRVKQALNSVRMATKTKSITPELNGRLLKNLELSARQYLSTEGKAANDRWRKVEEIRRTAAEQLSQLRPSEKMKNQAAELKNKLVEKGLLVPQGFENTLAQLCQKRQQAFDGLKHYLSTQKDNTILQVGEEIKQIGVYDSLKESIENGEITQKELDYLASRKPQQLYEAQGKIMTDTADMPFLTTHGHTAKRLRDDLLTGNRPSKYHTDIKQLCSHSKAIDAVQEEKKRVLMQRWGESKDHQPERVRIKID